MPRVHKPRPLRIAGYGHDVGHAWIAYPSRRRYVSMTATPLLFADVVKARRWLGRALKWQSDEGGLLIAKWRREGELCR